MRAFVLLALSILLFGCIAGQQKQSEQNISGTVSGNNGTPLPAKLNETPAMPVIPPNNGSTGNVSPVNFTNSSSILHPDRLQVYYYYSRYCGYCRLTAPIVEAEEGKFGNSTEWHKFDVYTQEGYNEFDRMALSRNLSNSSRVVPILIAGGKMLIGFPEINSTLDGLLLNSTK